MNELLNAMAIDMGISPYDGESIISFSYRVIYSALGRWCLEVARANEGTSKRGQSVLLNDLLEKYLLLFPEINGMLVSEDQIPPSSSFIRRIYEETGYLITDQNNRNHLADYQRGICINSKNLIFGLSENVSFEGLGVFSEEATAYTVNWQEVILRDSLSYDEYVSSAFDISLFTPRDINTDSLQYFNPMTNLAPSSSWASTINTDRTVARDLANGAYYRVLRYKEEMLYYDDVPNAGVDRLTDFEYRRLYFALKKQSGFPLKAHVQSLDKHYIKVTLDGHLPNREYYLILLYSWPCQMYWNKREFIMKKDYLEFTREILENLGIEIIGG